MIQHKIESSSSEEEIDTKALKQAANPDFLQYLSTSYTTTFSINNSSNCFKKKIKSKHSDLIDYYKYKLSESQKAFISKKLNERLATSIILYNNIHSEKKKKIICQGRFGIKLFSSSNIILSKDKKLKKCIIFKSNNIYNEKLNFFKCQEIVMNSERIYSQQEVKYWMHRKPLKQYKYKKLNNGILLKI